MFISLYMLPALLAFAIKIALLAWALYQGSFRRDWLIFSVVLCLQSLVETSAFFFSEVSAISEYFVRLHWVGSIAIMSMSLYYVSAYDWQQKVAKLCLLLAIIFSCVTMATDAFVAGYKITPILVTAVYGQHFLVYVTFVVGLAVLALSFSFSNIYHARNNASEIAALYHLLAISPFVLVTIIVVILLSMGFKPSLIVLLPVASTLFIICTYFGTAELVRDPRLYIPGMRAYRANQEMAKVISDYVNDQRMLPDTMEALEKALIQYKFEINKGNAQNTADALGVPRSTFYSKLDRLGINTKSAD